VAAARHVPNAKKARCQRLDIATGSSRYQRSTSVLILGFFLKPRSFSIVFKAATTEPVTETTWLIVDPAKSLSRLQTGQLIVVIDGLFFSPRFSLPGLESWRCPATSCGIVVAVLALVVVLIMVAMTTMYAMEYFERWQLTSGHIVVKPRVIDQTNAASSGKSG